MTNTLLHKVVALQTTSNFQVNRRYVVNYRQPEQPVQVVDGVVTSVTNSTVWFEKLPIPTDSILNVCALLSLPPEVLRLTVSFLDPATQCVIAPTSKLILKSVNEQQSSPGQFISCDQRLLAAWNITQPFLDHICHAISRCSLSFEGIRVQEMESCLKNIPMDFRGYVRDILRHSSSNIRQIEMLLTQRENDPIIRYAQDIQVEVYNCSISCHSPAVQRLEECLSTIPIHFRAPVRDSFRSSEFGFFNIIEALLTQRENNPIIRYAQDIEADIIKYNSHEIPLNEHTFHLRTMDYYRDSIQQMEKCLQSIPKDYHDSVRNALRNSDTNYIRHIENLLTQKEKLSFVRAWTPVSIPRHCTTQPNNLLFSADTTF